MPGSVIGAVLLGALIVHGLQPGPLLFRQNRGGVRNHRLGAGGERDDVCPDARRSLDRPTLGGAATGDACDHALLLVGGAYALNGQLVDVVVMLAFGVIGWRMEKAKLPLAAFVIGFVLAPVAEENLCAGLMASGGSYAPLLTCAW